MLNWNYSLDCGLYFDGNNELSLLFVNNTVVVFLNTVENQAIIFSEDLVVP